MLFSHNKSSICMLRVIFRWICLYIGKIKLKCIEGSRGQGTLKLVQTVVPSNYISMHVCDMRGYGMLFDLGKK